MSLHTTQRRRFIQVTCLTTIAIIPGCFDPDDESGEDDTDEDVDVGGGY